MEVREVLEDKHIDFSMTTKDYVIKCLSPEHDDATPSCNVDKITGIFNCWSCGYSGDIYKEFNVEVPNQVNNKVEFLLKKIKKLAWSKELEMPSHTLCDWEFRGISKETMQHFEAFISDDKSFDMEGRINFPLRDMDRKIQLFVCRQMYSDIKPKYKYYPAHVELPLYPDIPVITKGSIILVEGIFDLLNLYDKGLKNVVQCGGVNLGSVKKRAKQQRNIERLLPYKYQGIHTLYLMFDGDEAGRRAALGLESYASNEFKIKIIDLEDGQDPGSLTQEEVNKLNEELYG